MILSDDEVAKRLNSPLNLINRLAALGEDNNRKKESRNAMNLFIRLKQEAPKPSGPVQIPSIPANPINLEDQPATLDSLIQNHEAQIQLGLAHNNSIDLLNRSIGLLSAKLDDVKADRLPAVISTASKVVESIRRERAESAKNNREREVHYHFYTPQQKKIEDFEVIEVQ